MSILAPVIGGSPLGSGGTRVLGSTRRADWGPRSILSPRACCLTSRVSRETLTRGQEGGGAVLAERPAAI